MAVYRTVFVVYGKGKFPLDMLRYDSCFPANSAAVHDLEDYGWKVGHQREVELAHLGFSKKWGPTRERWASFGWLVEYDTRVEKVV